MGDAVVGMLFTAPAAAAAVVAAVATLNSTTCAKGRGGYDIYVQLLLACALSEAVLKAASQWNGLLTNIWFLVVCLAATVLC
jgi:hypothetical protein